MRWRSCTVAFTKGCRVGSRNSKRRGANEEIARKIHQSRTAANLTQGQLGKLVGTTTPVICHLEDADREGHPLAILRRIATALHQRVEIRFVPMQRST